MGTANPIQWKQTRQEYIQDNNSRPEDDFSNIYSGEKRIPHSAIDRVVDPDDNRKLAQKLWTFLIRFLLIVVLAIYTINLKVMICLDEKF